MRRGLLLGWLGMALAVAQPARAALCAGFDPTLGVARYHAWQNQPAATLAVINKARAAGAICPEAAGGVELARIEGALRLGLRHEAARALQRFEAGGMPMRGHAALLMADLAYLDGRLDEVGRWLVRVGPLEEERAAARAGFLRAEVARASGRFTDALDLSRELPGSLAGYVWFNVAASALASDRAALAERAARILIDSPAYAPAEFDLRQRGRLVLASALLARSDLSGAAAALDGVAAGGMYARAALAQRISLALARNDGQAVARLAGHLPGGEGDLARGYLLERAGEIARARDFYVTSLEALDGRGRMLSDVRRRSLEIAREMTRDPDSLEGAPPAVARFIASPHTMRLLGAVRDLDGRLARLDAAARSLDVLAAVAAEADRRALASAAAADTLDVRARLDELSAAVARNVPSAQDDAWYFANPTEGAQRDRLRALADRARVLGRPDLERRAARMLGRLLWDLEWRLSDRRYAAERRHARLAARVAELRRRLTVVEAAAERARRGGIARAGFDALDAAIATTRGRVTAHRTEAIASLARALEGWADRQLQALAAVRGYATVAVARSNDRLLLSNAASVAGTGSSTP